MLIKHKDYDMYYVEYLGSSSLDFYNLTRATEFLRRLEIAGSWENIKIGYTTTD